MSKFNKGDKVRVVKGLGEGQSGVVTDPCWQISQSDWPCVEFLKEDGTFSYADEDNMELTDDPYEYAMQLTFGDTPRRIENWTTKEIAEEKLKWHGDGSKSHADPVWGPWTAKLVKRRKAGPIEDVT